MHQSHTFAWILIGFILIFVNFYGSSAFAGTKDQVRTVQLTQTPCQFLEPETKDRGFRSKNAADCEKINQASQKQRIKESKPMKLAAGAYLFRVTNKNVPYELGFWLRGQGLQRITLPSVSGGGIHPGKTKEYRIHLKPGKYYYSCPLNPTPDYTLIVE